MTTLGNVKNSEGHQRRHGKQYWVRMYPLLMLILLTPDLRKFLSKKCIFCCHTLNNIPVKFDASLTCWSSYQMWLQGIVVELRRLYRWACVLVTAFHSGMQLSLTLLWKLQSFRLVRYLPKAFHVFTVALLDVAVSAALLNRAVFGCEVAFALFCLLKKVPCLSMLSQHEYVTTNCFCFLV